MGDAWYWRSTAGRRSSTTGWRKSVSDRTPSRIRRSLPFAEENKHDGTSVTISSVPFFRPSVGEEEIAQVVATLRSGWLTTGPRVREFEQEFAAAVGARHAVAVNSCTAALH